MKAHDVAAMMATEAEMHEPGSFEFWRPEGFNGGHVWVGRFKGTGPWSRQPEADSVFYVLDGWTEVTVLTDDGQETIRARTVREHAHEVLPQRDRHAPELRRGRGRLQDRCGHHEIAHPVRSPDDQVPDRGRHRSASAR